MANLLGKRELEDDFETKPTLRKHKGSSEEQEVAVRKKTLFFGHFSPQTEISDIINFFTSVEGVVRVQLVVDQKVNHRGYGFVEFASANEATKALQNKNGEDLHGCKILLHVVLMGAADFPPKFCVDHKFWAEHNLPKGEDVTFPYCVEDFGGLGKRTLFVSNLSPQTKLPDIINFFSKYGKLVSVRLIVNHEGKHVGYGFVLFSAARIAKKWLIEKNRAYFHDHQIFLALASTFSYTTQPKYNLAARLWYEDYLRREINQIEEEEEDETPHEFVEEVAVRKKTLFVGHFSPQTEISDIFNFFKDVGEVVHVRLSVDSQSKHVGYGFVEFASTNEAEMALEKKNGEYLNDRKMFLDVANTDPYPAGHKYIDYLRGESFPIEEVETIEGLVEEFDRKQRTLYFRRLSSITKKSDIVDFFKDVGEVVHVYLFLDREEKFVRYGLVEFASTNEAKKALEKNGEYLRNQRIYLYVDKKDPHPLPMCYIDHKVWYEDYLGRESLLIEDEEDETMEGLVEEVARSKKTLFVTRLAQETEISDITNFFEDAGEVVRVRLIVNHMGEHVGCGFVEFASVHEAKKALTKKKSWRLSSSTSNLSLDEVEIAPYLIHGHPHPHPVRDEVEIAPYPLRPKYNDAEKTWYKYYFPRESCLMEELMGEKYLEPKPNMNMKKNMKKQKEKVMDTFCGKKTTFSEDD